MNPFEIVAAVTCLFFAVGVAVGVLLVVAMSRDGRPRGLNGGRPQQFGELHPDPRDQPGSGPPAEPDDRDDYPWWARGR